MKPGLVELLELYEYKVDDLVAGQEPKGGMAGLTRLRQALIQANLPGPLAKKFRDIDARFKAHRLGYKTTVEEGPTSDLGAILVEEEPNPPDPERQTLEKLAEAVYWARLEREMGRVAKTLNQGKRDELRLVYAILQNLEAYAKNPLFTQDYNLSRFTLAHPIPSVSDPLVRIDDPSTAQSLLLELFREAFSIAERLHLPPEETVPYLRRFARRVLESEGALKSPLRGPSLESLRRALEEAHRQGLSPAEIRTLEERLQAAAAEERRLALVMEEDRMRFSAAIERLSNLLSRYLPSPRGEASWPQLPQKILGSPNPTYALSEVPPEAKALSLRLMPLRFTLGGYQVAISQAGPVFSVSVEGQERILEGNAAFSLTLPNAEMRGVRYQDYLHLWLEPREAATLSSLLAEGRVLAHLMWPENHYAYLRLLRALSARFKGPVNYAAFQPESASKYAEAPIDNLQEFARKGLEVVRGRIQRHSSWAAYLSEVAQGMGLEDYAQVLYIELSEWLGFSPPSRDTLGQGAGSTTVSEAPSTIKAGSTALSLRYQDGVIYVSSTGLVPRKLADLLVWVVPEGGLVLAREGARVAYNLILIPPRQ
ncbi:MAG: hypothetical protein NZL94_07255 [Meiothermus sp.]|uniref:hypothetical protein n=1 Tax=Meiothermus sp. TaxID=1955249 RepID=UPI002606C7C6|nr:hypothetical protein [Meiothermus sp.]MCS7058663.1 hypothetical protein [Meiothermus sp.]MDW8090010.1 hypothetical protein [Meiothermus sp.]